MVTPFVTRVTVCRRSNKTLSQLGRTEEDCVGDVHAPDRRDVPARGIARAPHARRRPATVHPAGRRRARLRARHGRRDPLPLRGQLPLQQTTRRPGELGGQPVVATEPEVDLDYHIRHSAVPRPGRIRELFQLTSRWHGTLLDRHRPMWETHLVEGLEDGRFAVYTKVHHSLSTASPRCGCSSSAGREPRDTAMRVPWDPRPRKSHHGGTSRGGPLALPLSVAGKGLSLGTTAAGLVPAGLKVLTQAVRDHDFITPFEAPRTLLNGPHRRRATVRRAVVGDRAGARRRRRHRRDAQRRRPRDVQRRAADLSDGTRRPAGQVAHRDGAGVLAVGHRERRGNAVGAVICSLATDLEDPSTVFERSVSRLRRRSD